MDVVAPACRPLRYYRYDLPTQVSLPCTPKTVKVFDQSVPSRGRALARITAHFLNQGSAEHFWNLTVVAGAVKYAYGNGDDACPGAGTLYKTNVGIGELTDAANRVSVIATSGSPSCSSGAMKMLAGAYLEVWVTDPSPACQAQQIKWVSWYQTHNMTPAYWAGFLSPLLSLSLTPSKPETSYRIFDVVEGSPNPVGYGCKNANSLAYLWLQSTFKGKPIQTRQWPIPPSLGMGHLVLWTDRIVTTTAADLGSSLVTKMLIAKSLNASTTTGGCCGDGAIFALDVTDQVDCRRSPCP